MELRIHEQTLIAISNMDRGWQTLIRELNSLYPAAMLVVFLNLPTLETTKTHGVIAKHC
jgi:hypothetical protein